MAASRRHLALSSIFGFAVPALAFGLAALAIGGGDLAFAQLAPTGTQPLLIEREPPGATKPMFAPPVLVPPGASGGVPMPSGPAVPPQAIHIPAPAAPVAVPAAPPVTIIPAPIAAPTASSSPAVPPEPKAEPKPEPKPVTPPAEAAPVVPPAVAAPTSPAPSDAVVPPAQAPAPAPVPAPVAPAAGPVPAPAPADATPAQPPAAAPPAAEPAKPAPVEAPAAAPVAPGAPGAAVVPSPPPAAEAPAPVPPPAATQLVPVEVEVAARPVIFVTGVTTWEKAEEKLDGVFVTLAEAARKLGVQPAGAPLVEYIESDSDDIGYRAMIPVETAPKGKLPKGVKVGQSTGGKALKFRHAGPLDDLEEVYSRIDDELAKRNLDTRAIVEEYDGDALASPEDRVVMDIYVFPK